MNASPPVHTLDRQNFEAWYAGILKRLYPIRDAGIIERLSACRARCAE